MDVITIESQAFKDLTAKINTIAKFVIAYHEAKNDDTSDGWVDNHEVCTFLKVSPRTLQRLRASKVIVYTRIRGKTFYRISEVKRMMDNNIIRRSEELLQNLINNYQLQQKSSDTTC